MPTTNDNATIILETPGIADLNIFAEDPAELDLETIERGPAGRDATINGVTTLTLIAENGLGYTQNGDILTLFVDPATTEDIDAATDEYKPITSNNLYYAILRGIAYNNLTFTEQERAAALSWLGVNDSTITITQGGETKGSFTLNQDGSATIEIDPGQITQLDEIPTAAEEYVGPIYEYTGTTTSNYIHGYFYECVSDGLDPATYSWQRVTVQPVTEVIDNLNSTSATSALSANQGRELESQIVALEGRGHYLAAWDCSTGLATTNPPSSPYTYHSGDYFIVAVVDSTTNYKPSGTQYTTGVASTVVETEEVAVNDTYTYDGTNWTLLKTSKVDALPPQSGNSGKFLTTDGSSASWAEVDALPDQTGNAGKILTTNGSDASWMDIPTNYSQFPASWNTSSTTLAFCNAVAADTTAVAGKVYLGEVYFSDLPENIYNSELVVEVVAGTTSSTKVIVLTLTSGNTYPYMWKYTYWNGGSNVSNWIGFQPKLTAGLGIDITNDTVTSTGNKNKNTATGADAVKYDWVGTLSQYTTQDIEHTHPEWTCYITDDQGGIGPVYNAAESDLRYFKKDVIDRATISEFGYPDVTRAESLTPLASGSEYTAPTNGWFFTITGATGSNCHTYIRYAANMDNLFRFLDWKGTAGGGVNVWCPVKGGETVIINYNSGTLSYVYFIPAFGQAYTPSNS